MAFIELDHVKASTTRKQVRRFFEHGANGNPTWALKGSGGTLVLSPGHTVYWKHRLPAGKYVEACWWPSDEDGTPHALMGMWALTRLR